MTARKLAIVLTLLLAAAGARAQDFYAERMRRGVANYQRGNYVQAVADFRIAAFGLLDAPADYETALIYGVLANQRLGNNDDARQTAEKIVNVERVAPVYTTLRIPPELRGEIEAALPKLLRSEQLARVPAFAHLAPRSTAPQAAPQPPRVEPPRPTPSSLPPASGARAISLLQSGDEAAARATAEKIVIDDYTNALAQTVLAILAGRRGDWAGVVEHYSVVRTRRRLTDDENNTFYLGLVRTGRTADAAGVEKLRGFQPFVAKAPAHPRRPPCGGRPDAARGTYHRRPRRLPPPGRDPEPAARRRARRGPRTEPDHRLPRLLRRVSEALPASQRRRGPHVLRGRQPLRDGRLRDRQETDGPGAAVTAADARRRALPRQDRERAVNFCPMMLF